MRSELQNILMIVLMGCALAELVYALVRKTGLHSYRDTLSSVSLGIGQQAINIYLSAGFLAFYVGVYETAAFVHADMGVWWHWVLLIFACDFSYYVGHRCGHTVNFWVAAHVVHHHAEDFNLLSAMRQSWTAWIVMFPFFLPLALFGVPLEMFVYGQLGIMFFQFMSHTGAFRMRLGVLDGIFITPRNHRVHHGYNRNYWGANCGGMFVIWDRVFGTYVQEDPANPVKLGAGLDFNFYDPFDANFDYYRRVWFVSRRRAGLWPKLAIWFQSPDTLRKELARLGYDQASARVERLGLSGRDKRVAAAALVGSIGLLWAHRLLYPNQPFLVNLATGFGVFLALYAVGRLLSRRATAQASLVSSADVTFARPGRSQVSAK